MSRPVRFCLFFLRHDLVGRSSGDVPVPSFVPGTTSYNTHTTMHYTSARYTVGEIESVGEL